MSRLRWQVPRQAAGDRLDRHVAQEGQAPRSRVKRSILEGRVEVDGKAAKPSLILAGGEWVEWDPREPEAEPRLIPEARDLAVLYEDRHLAIIDKPAGVVVHPGAGQHEGTLVHFLLARYPEIATVGSPERPGIVHRLDQGTSGALVVARSAKAYRSLAAAFASHLPKKTYLALIYGRPDPPTGQIERPLGRDPRERKRMAVRPGGRRAVTRYRTLGSEAGISLLEIDLETGRTHQIRVHMKSLGHPLVGDPVYGEARWKGLEKSVQGALRSFDRPALHAWRLALRHPESAEAMVFEAPLSEDLRKLWEETTRLPFPPLP